MLNPLLLQSGNDIPLLSAGLVIHPPTIKEIGYIGEKNFWNGVQFLDFSKSYINTNQNLNQLDDFDILAALVMQNDQGLKTHIAQLKLVLTLILPNYYFSVQSGSFVFIDEADKEQKDKHIINSKNFGEFKSIIQEMFCMNTMFGHQKNYNPGGAMAEALVKKFEARRKKLAELNKGKGGEFNVLDLYVSVLSVGLKKSKRELLKYTVYQLFDEFQRFTLKESSDMTMKLKLANVKEVKDAENWMKNIHGED